LVEGEGRGENSVLVASGSFKRWVVGGGWRVVAGGACTEGGMGGRVALVGIKARVRKLVQ
jgi:hypothetical protein